jgi:preprotein translocase subunit SecG
VQLTYNIFMIVGVLLAIVFSALVLITGKGDAMSGGSSIRTSFKGKASFDDIMSNWTLYIGVGFMAVALLIDILGARLPK